MSKKAERVPTPLLANVLGCALVFTLVGSFWALVKSVDWLGTATSHRTPGTKPYLGSESKHWGMGDRFLEFFGFGTDSTVVVSHALLWTSRLGFAVGVVLIVVVARSLMSARSGSS